MFWFSYATVVIYENMEILKKIRIDILLYYTCVHCLLSMSASMRLKIFAKYKCIYFCILHYDTALP